MDENWQDVVDRKVAAYDWHLSLPQAAATACEYYSAMLDEADEFSRSAQLLTPPRLRYQHRGPPLVPLRAGQPAPWPGPHAVDPQPPSRRPHAAGHVMPGRQRASRAAFLKTLA